MPDSDACLILVDEGGVAVSGDTALVEKLAAQYGKPLLVVDIGAADAIAKVRAWLSPLLARMTATRRSDSRSAAHGRARRRGYMGRRGWFWSCNFKLLQLNLSRIVYAFNWRR